MHLFYKRVRAAIISSLFCLGLLLVWLYHYHILFVLLCMFIFFSMLAFNGNNIRRYVPGINSDKFCVRCLIHIFLLGVSFYIISTVVLYR